MGLSPEIPRVIIGQSPRMRHVLRQVDKLGQARWPVLILGETGTGKEVIARAIHKVQNNGPFVTIDCSALVAPLMESELFGHAKGAFTGAAGHKLGLIELADGGTAFLDEIGELPLDMQSKLLRVLQEKEFRPVGATSQRKSDFRVIAATNRDLASEVTKGLFRRDLYYRLNVVTLRLTPLRDRKEDIPGLVSHFLQKFGTNHKMLPETVEKLCEYDWPGNVRELENTIQHMVAVNSGPLLHSIDLPSAIQNRTLESRPQQFSMAVSATQPVPQARSIDSNGPVIPLDQLEKRAILNALRHTKGDRASAAALLGIGRTTLYRKLKEYDLDSNTPS